MDTKKPYVVAILIQVIYTGMFVVLKATFNQGFNTFVFTFYCQAAASVLLVPIAFFRERNTFAINMLNVALRFTSATVQSAISNSKAVSTFCLALLLRMEVVNLKSPYGVAKVTGVVLCLAGVLVIAFFTGPPFSPVNHHRAFQTGRAYSSTGHAAWIKGTFLKLSGDLAWSLWIVFQAALLKEFPNKMLVTVIQCVFSTVQALVVAAVAERDITRWKLRPDISLLAIIYTGFVVSGLSYFLQVWCMEMKGPVFFAVWMPLGFIFTMFCSSFFLGEIIHLGSILGGILLIGGLYSVLWAKSKETTIEPACSVESAQDSKEHMKPVGNQEKEQGRARGGNISI
uniref:WAT1-related protein n=1 Tax=Setaria italica TaxID=4555 RepID=K3ZUX4_SETIT